MYALFIGYDIMESFYDKEIDSLGITITDKKDFAYSKEIYTGVYIDFNEKNEPIGLEIHNIKKFMKNKVYQIDMDMIYETSPNKTEKDVYEEIQKLLNQFKVNTGKEITINNIDILDIE